MSKLTLKAGGTLEFYHVPHHDEVQINESNLYEVSSRAHAFLFEPLSVEPDVTVGDVFKLLATCPVLQEIYSHNFAKQLCEEADKGAIAANDVNPEDALEYVEIYQDGYYNTAESIYSNTVPAAARGLGPVLTVDRPSVGLKAGQRIEWGLGFAPLRQLLSLPLRLDLAVTVFEGNRDSCRYRQVIAKATKADLTLGQVLGGLLKTLSTHGSPAMQEAALAKFKAQIAAPSTAKQAAAVSQNDMFMAMGLEHPLKPVIEAVFVNLGGLTAGQVYRALRKIEDDVEVATGLKALLGEGIILKPEYHDMSALKFRTMLRKSIEN